MGGLGLIPPWMAHRAALDRGLMSMRMRRAEWTEKDRQKHQHAQGRAQIFVRIINL
jgi:hypothetical protein